MFWSNYRILWRVTGCGYIMFSNCTRSLKVSNVGLGEKSNRININVWDWLNKWFRRGAILTRALRVWGAPALRSGAASRRRRAWRPRCSRARHRRRPCRSRRPRRLISEDHHLDIIGLFFCVSCSVYINYAPIAWRSCGYKTVHTYIHDDVWMVLC